jgi:transmembrane sensor
MITPNKAKPFIIKTGNATIKVVGTSFNVKNKNGYIEVVVETGIVQVSLNQTMVSLKPGEMALVNPETGKIIKLKTPDNLYNYYRSKEFVAQNVPLSRLVQVLNEAYNSHIVIDKAVPKELALSGVLKTRDSVGDILKVLCLTLNLKMEKHQNQIVLKK